MKNTYKKRNSGQAILMVVIMCTSIFLTIVLGVIDPLVNELRLSNDLLRSKSSFYTAESSTEDAVFRVKNNMIVNYSAPIYININNYNATTTVSNTDGVKTIDTTGSDMSNFRKIKTKVVSGLGADFYYGVQAGIDGFTFSGGGTIDGNVYSSTAVTASSGLINGDVWAQNVTGVNASGSLYCVTGTSNNKDCDTSRNNLPVQAFPISDADITKWKDEASVSVRSGNYTIGSDGATLGPKKITGNLRVEGGGVLTLTGTVWVQGDITFVGNSGLSLDPGYGATGGVLLADGEIHIGGGSVLSGSGADGSFPLLISTSDDSDAIDITGGAGAVVLVAQSGTVNISGGTSAKAVVGKKVVIDSGGSVNYDSNLADFNFSSGPNAGWNISSWKEVQ